MNQHDKWKDQTIGLYYHIPAHIRDGKVSLPGFYGVFVESLAEQVESLVLFVHTLRTDDDSCDFVLGAQNIQVVDLGRKAHAFFRTFLGTYFLSRHLKIIGECSALVVRSPTPLLKSFHTLGAGRGVRVLPLVVGDPMVNGAFDHLPWPKRLWVRWLRSHIARHEKQVVNGGRVLVNSAALFDKYVPIASDIVSVRTSTLRSNSFFVRDTTFNGERTRILFTGRFDWQKGLKELISAFIKLNLEYDLVFELHLVGWEENSSRPIRPQLEKIAAENGLGNLLFFHGRKPVGPELDEMYRQSDVFILPSYHEGFPRTIWEAMANSCPVIVSRVGGIPEILRHEVDALLIDPYSIKQILVAVLRLKNDPGLCTRLINEGRRLARENTLEAQAKIIIDNCRRAD